MTDKLKALFEATVRNLVGRLNEVKVEVQQNTQDMEDEMNTTKSANETNITGVTNSSVESHEYVDLKLKKGTLWAACNLGADSPEVYGDYYAWGELSPYYANSGDATKKNISGSGSWKSGKESGYTWSSYKFSVNGSSSEFNKYNSSDKKTTLDAADDIVASTWGENWRMPTKEDFEELLEGCTYEYTSYSGATGSKAGFLFTSKVDPTAKLFFPCAYYRSGTTLEGIGGLNRYIAYHLADKPASDVSSNYAFFFESGGSISSTIQPKPYTADSIDDSTYPLDLSSLYSAQTIWGSLWAFPGYTPEGADRNRRGLLDTSGKWAWDPEYNNWQGAWRPNFASTVYENIVEEIISDTKIVNGVEKEWEPGDYIRLKTETFDGPIVFTKYYTDTQVEHSDGTHGQPVRKRKMQWKQLGGRFFGVKEISRCLGCCIRPVMASGLSGEISRRQASGQDVSDLGVKIQITKLPANVVGISSDIPMRNWACDSSDSKTAFSENTLKSRLGLTVQQLSELVVGRYSRVYLSDGTILTVTGASGDFIAGKGELILGPARLFVYKYFNLAGRENEGEIKTVYFRIHSFIDGGLRMYQIFNKSI